MSKAGAVATASTWPVIGGRWRSSPSAATGGLRRLAGFEHLACNAWKVGGRPSAGRSSGQRSPGGPRARVRARAVEICAVAFGRPAATSRPCTWTAPRPATSSSDATAAIYEVIASDPPTAVVVVQQQGRRARPAGK